MIGIKEKCMHSAKFKKDVKMPSYEKTILFQKDAKRQKTIRNCFAKLMADIFIFM